MLQYNREDVLNLEILMERAFELGWKRLLKRTRADGPGFLSPDLVIAIWVSPIYFSCESDVKRKE